MTRLPQAAAAASVTRLLFEMTERQGAALLLATHDPELASRCRRRFRLAGGRLLPPADLGGGDGGEGRRGCPVSPPEAP